MDSTNLGSLLDQGCSNNRVEDVVVESGIETILDVTRNHASTDKDGGEERDLSFMDALETPLAKLHRPFYQQQCILVPNNKHSRSILKRLSAMAVVMGVVNSQVAVWILRTLGVYLTKDAAIVQMMRDHTGFFGLAILLHLVIMVAEGAVIASRDFWNLIKTYIITVCFHFGMLKFASGSFPAVWRTFFFFQPIRLVNFGYRVIKGQTAARRGSKRSPAVDGDPCNMMP